ncbi:MAG: DUF3501 family protein [Limibacillus sp.]
MGAEMKTEITRQDIMPIDDYIAERKERRKQLVETKRNRRVEVGPVATWYFENYETMWNQVHEMLYIERGGEEQIADELAAYNPLIPQGSELIATIMFEMDDPERRKRLLSKIGGIEEKTFMKINGETVEARPEADVDRTSADGKASSVQFVHFDLTPEQVKAFKSKGAEIVVGFSHPDYHHMTQLSELVRAALAEDLS